MRALYAVDGEQPLTVIALGDSENDSEMLQNRADIAVVIRRHDGSHLDCQAGRQTLLTEQPGPGRLERGHAADSGPAAITRQRA